MATDTCAENCTHCLFNRRMHYELKPTNESIMKAFIQPIFDFLKTYNGIGRLRFSEFYINQIYDDGKFVEKISNEIYLEFSYIKSFTSIKFISRELDCSNIFCIFRSRITFHIEEIIDELKIFMKEIDEKLEDGKEKYEEEKKKADETIIPQFQEYEDKIFHMLDDKTGELKKKMFSMTENDENLEFKKMYYFSKFGEIRMIKLSIFLNKKDYNLGIISVQGSKFEMIAGPNIKFSFDNFDEGILKMAEFL